MLKRKYMSEFGLNVFTSYKSLIPISELEKVYEKTSKFVF